MRDSVENMPDNSDEYWDLYSKKLKGTLELRNILLEVETILRQKGLNSSTVLAAALGEILEAFPFGTKEHQLVHNIITKHINHIEEPLESDGFLANAAKSW